MDTDQEKRKQKGLKAYSKWRAGPFRGHWDKRKEIIDKYGLTDEEYYTLKIAFHDGYVSNNGMIPSSAEMNFFQLFNRVWLAQWGLKQMEKKGLISLSRNRIDYSPLCDKSF